MFGYNIIASFLRDRQKAISTVGRLAPNTCVVIDDIAFARAIRSASPRTLVILRPFDSRENSLHLQMSPAQWMAQFAVAPRTEFMLYVLNEPDGYTDLRSLSRWCAEIMEIAAARGVRLCLPNFSVGHPDERRINAGELDEMLRAFGRFPQHVLGLHEYAQQSTRAERPYIIGRYQRLLERCDMLRVTRPRVIMTEYGRDVAGREGDGWRDAGFTEDSYYTFLTGAADIYKPDEVDVCIFSYGPGFANRFRSFDVENADRLNERLIAYNQTDRGDPMSVPKPADAGTGVRVRVTATSGTFVNVRSGPGTNYAAVGQVRKDDTLTYYPAKPTRNGAYNWVFAELAASGGWIALEVLTLSPVTTTPPPTPTPPTPTPPNPTPVPPLPFTAAEAEQVLALHQELIRLHQQQLSAHQRLVTLYNTVLARRGNT